MLFLRYPKILKLAFKMLMKNSSFPKTMQQSFSRVDERQKIRLQVEFSITLYILDFFSEEILFQTD